VVTHVLSEPFAPSNLSVLPIFFLALVRLYRQLVLDQHEQRVHAIQLRLGVSRVRRGFFSQSDLLEGIELRQLPGDEDEVDPKFPLPAHSQEDQTLDQLRPVIRVQLLFADQGGMVFTHHLAQPLPSRLRTKESGVFTGSLLLLAVAHLLRHFASELSRLVAHPLPVHRLHARITNEIEHNLNWQVAQNLIDLDCRSARCPTQNGSFQHLLSVLRDRNPIEETLQSGHCTTPLNCERLG
jgi:hypothetical protein